VSQTPLSLDDDENFIDPPDDVEPDEFAADRERVRDTILGALQNKKLPRDRDFCIRLISLRFGLDTGVPLTLRETERFWAFRPSTSVRSKTSFSRY